MLKVFPSCSLLAAALVVMGLGCGKSQEAATEALLESSLSSDGAKVDVALEGDGEQISISTQTEEGTVNMSLGGQTQIPADFPEDVPVYENLQVMLAHQVVEQGSFSIQGTVEAPVAQVTQFYRAETEKQGWKVETTTSMPQMENFILKKGPRTLSVSLVGTEGTTSVTLTVSQEQ